MIMAKQTINLIRIFSLQYSIIVDISAPVVPPPIESIPVIMLFMLSSCHRAIMLFTKSIVFTYPEFSGSPCLVARAASSAICRQSWVFPEPLSPASSVMPLRGMPPASRASSSGQPSGRGDSERSSRSDSITDRAEGEASDILESTVKPGYSSRL